MNNKHETLVAMVAISIIGLFIRPANAGLVACWKLDDASGSIASDSSGSDNVGKLRGNPIWVTGRMKSSGFHLR